jgi:hypothetical protein
MRERNSKNHASRMRNRFRAAFLPVRSTNTPGAASQLLTLL